MIKQAKTRRGTPNRNVRVSASEYNVQVVGPQEDVDALIRDAELGRRFGNALTAAAALFSDE